MLRDDEVLKIKHAIETHDLSGEDYKLLDDMIYEYCQYRRCGSPEDCRQRKEWMEMSSEDVRDIIRESQITKRIVKKRSSTRSL